MAGEEWLYRNPFPGARRTDDEIAVATCTDRMAAYADGGPGFYGLPEASQDHYLGLRIDGPRGAAMRCEAATRCGAVRRCGRSGRFGRVAEKEGKRYSRWSLGSPIADDGAVAHPSDPRPPGRDG